MMITRIILTFVGDGVQKMSSKQIKYGDFFLDVTKQRRIRNMRREVREERIKEYIKRAEKELPLFEGDK